MIPRKEHSLASGRVFDPNLMHGEAHNWYTTTTKMSNYLPIPEIHGLQSYQGRHLKEQFYQGLHPIWIVKRVILLGSTSERSTLVFLESSFSRTTLIRVQILKGQSEGAILFEPTS